MLVEDTTPGSETKAVNWASWKPVLMPHDSHVSWWPCKEPMLTCAYAASCLTGKDHWAGGSHHFYSKWKEKPSLLQGEMLPHLSMLLIANTALGNQSRKRAIRALSSGPTQQDHLGMLRGPQHAVSPKSLVHDI